MDIDLSAWVAITPEPGGRDQRKEWMAAQSDADRSKHWLWKPRTHTGDGSEPALNDCAEVVTSRLASSLGIPAAECRYARWNGALGVISRNVSPPGYDLHDGDVYLSQVDGYSRRPPQFDSSGRQVGRVRSDVGYTLDAVTAVLEGVAGPPGWEDLTAAQVFAGYLVFDALIANTDRHPKNWAILERQSDGALAIAPSFDHGTALGSGLTEENRKTRDPVAFCRRGRANPFGHGRESLLALALRATAVAGAGFWLERVASLTTDEIEGALAAPSGRLSVQAATFMREVLRINKERVCDAYRSQG